MAQIFQTKQNGKLQTKRKKFFKSKEINLGLFRKKVRKEGGNKLDVRKDEHGKIIHNSTDAFQRWMQNFDHLLNNDRKNSVEAQTSSKPKNF